MKPEVRRRVRPLPALQAYADQDPWPAPHWLWRAVDQDGYVLDEILRTRRNTKAARRLLTRLLKQQGFRLGRTIADKLKSYRAARRNASLDTASLA